MTTLRLHNTLTRRKEDFVPFDATNVRVYACGPTVYDNLHIGNGRMLIVFDVLFRLLRHVYGDAHVTYVRNITDIDDKIAARAAERGIDIRELTDATIAIFHADAAALNCLPPTLEPRATDHIAPMIAIMQRLLANGHAYAADGHVLFDVPSMPEYGRLANKSLDEQIAGARVDVAPYKRSATDFVLWKPSAANEPGWDSPWGRGRPGWHLECSAMSWQHLGETFDIHGGGIDLVFPHHENEIAQSRCAFGHAIMAQVWMHNGHLQVEGEKMSKSLGNFVTIRDLWASSKFGGDAWAGDVLRIAMLKTHYRDPLDWTIRRLIETKRDLELWTSAIAKHDLPDAAFVSGALPKEFLDLIADDLNTAGAMAVVRSYAQIPTRNVENAIALGSMLRFLGVKNIQKPGFFRASLEFKAFESGPQPDLAEAQASAIALSLLASGFEIESQGVISNLESSGFYLNINDAGVAMLSNSTGAEFDMKKSELEQRINFLISLRLEARAAKDWKESDRLRDALADLGIAVKDSKDGTTWERKS